MKVKPDNKRETLCNIREWLVKLVKGSAIAMVIDVKRKILRMRQQSLRLQWDHQENDTLSDLSDLSWHSHLRQNQTDFVPFETRSKCLSQGHQTTYDVDRRQAMQPYTRHYFLCSSYFAYHNSDCRKNISY